MVYGAIIHRPESDMAYLTDDGEIRIILKAQRGDLDKITLYYDDRYDHKPKAEPITLDMEYLMSDEVYDYFGTKFRPEYSRLNYYFSILDKAGNHIYLYEDGFSTTYGWGRQRLFNLPYLHKEDAPNVPKWLKESVMYQIFPDSFATEKARLSGQGLEIKLTSGHTVSTKLGGTLNGITENIGYLEDLGINLIYLNPIFTALSYHKYDTVDFYNIDPCFGTKEDFKRLVDECHKRGIRVMLDLIFNHCSKEFFAFKDVMENGADSKYADWFFVHDFPVRDGENHNYETFGFYDIMPKINTANPEVERYLMDIARFWLSEFNFDGYRLDVANEVSHSFWAKFRHEMNLINPEAAIIGEVWHTSHSWLGYNGFHSVMNYPLLYAIWAFFAFGSLNPVQFEQTVNRIYMHYKIDHTFAMMNFLDTHDVGRFYTMAGQNIDKLKAAAAYLFTYPGLPSIYYGDEKGEEGNDIHDCRREMIWKNTHLSSDIHQYFKALITIRKSSKAFTLGEYRPFISDAKTRITGFSRFFDSENIICLFSGSTGMETLEITLENGNYQDLLNNQSFSVEKGMYALTFNPFEAKILKKTEV